MIRIDCAISSRLFVFCKGRKSVDFGLENQTNDTGRRQHRGNSIFQAKDSVLR
jgi:hypothetical protein